MSKSSKVKDILTKNIGLKIVALIVGAIIWLAVVNVSDPSKTVTVHNIPINITNESSITKKGLVFDVLTKQEVDVTVTGNRSVVSKMRPNDFKATASLKELSMVMAAPVTVKIKDRSLRRYVNIVSQSVNTVTIKVDKMNKERRPVEVNFIGKPADGYAAQVGSMSFNSVVIKGSETSLKRIDKVVAQCDVEDADSDFSEKCKLVFLNKNGKVIKPKHAKLKKKVVKVYVHLSQEKEVPISLATPGKPKKGYKVKSVELTPSTVKLVGDSKKLKDVEQLNITESIDLSGKSQNTEVDINLDKYVKEGLTIDGPHTVRVKILIEKK